MRDIFPGSLLELLVSESGASRPMHMPGHKRNIGLLPEGLPWGIDVTEVGPFDKLQSPEGILAEGQALAASLWGSESAFFLVGGSTAGILAGVRACTKRGDSVLISRNSHAAVYHALELCGLMPVYLDPPLLLPYGFFGGVTPEMVKQALKEHPDVSLAVITSPTYEGVISDVQGIAETLHARGIPLMVDEAHGAHLGFSREAGFFPAGAIECGADIVVHSLHKTLPSLTQTGLLHVNSGRVSAAEVQRQIVVFQSSSPSYPLMASIDHCVRLLIRSGGELKGAHTERLRRFYGATGGLERLKIVTRASLGEEVFDLDPAKLIIFTGYSGKSGDETAELLASRYGIRLELSCEGYAIAMTSVCDRPEDIDLLTGALAEFDRSCTSAECTTPDALPGFCGQVMGLEQAAQAEGEIVLVGEAAGRISREYIWRYPPGVPLLAPGQVVTRELADWLKRHNGERLYSSYGSLPEAISVVV